MVVRSKVLDVAVTAVVVFLVYAVTVHAGEVSVGVTEAIRVCLECIVPSTYAYMLLSDVLVRTGAYRVVGRALSPIARYALHLDGERLSVLLVSLVAGYPVGARMVASLERTHSVDSRTARRMYCYCYSGGLAYVLGTVGNGTRYGLAVAVSVYLSNVFANLLLAVVLNARSGTPKERPCGARVHLSGSTLVDSVEASFRAMVTVCTMVVAFSVAVTLLGSLGVSGVLSDWVATVLGASSASVRSVLDAILEVSHVAKVSIVGGEYVPILAVLFSFGGVCVTVQVASLAGESFSLWRFLASRAFTCAVSYVVCRYVCMRYLDATVPAGYLYRAEPIRGTSIVPSVCLMCMSFILLSQNTRHTGGKVI